MKELNDTLPLPRLAAALIEGESDAVANMANLSALIFDKTPDINWAGFYILKGQELVLGPFQGKPACVRIALGKGVCGAAAARRETILVDDVRAYPGHIACDAASRSEIVVPIIKKAGGVFGVLDIDSPLKFRFGPAEQAAFEEIAKIFTKACGL